MEPDKTVKFSMAFFKGVKEFGLEEAMNRISKLTEGDFDKTDIEMLSVALISLVVIYTPELIENDDFIDILSKTIEETPKSELDQRINMALELYKRKYGDLE